MTPRPSVSIREFARLIGVTHPAVIEAIKSTRLSKSVVIEDGKKSIVVFDGCLEWHQHKNYRKDHTDRKGSGAVIPNIMSKDISSDIDSHYSALIKQVEHGRITGALMPAAKFQNEAGEAFRACRDTLVNLPVLLSEGARSPIIQLLRTIPGAGDLQTFEEPMNEAILKIRRTAKGEVRKALLHAVSILRNNHAEQENLEEALNLPGI